MWEMYLWLPVLTNSAYKPVKKKRNFKKQEIHDVFIKTNYIELVSNLAWLI